MDNFNRILSFILGFIVIIVLVAVVINRLNVGKRLASFSDSLTKKTTPTPTPKKTARRIVPTETPAPTIIAYNGGSNTTKGGYKSTQGTGPSTIPATGAPTLLLPFAMGAFFAGKKLRNIGK